MLWTEQQDMRARSQAGFRPTKSTVHSLFSRCHAVHTNMRTAKQPLFTCFVDLGKAYNKVQHNLLWQALKLLGIHGSLLAAMQSLYRDAQLAVGITRRLVSNKAAH